MLPSAPSSVDSSRILLGDLVSKGVATAGAATITSSRTTLWCRRLDECIQLDFSVDKNSNRVDRECVGMCEQNVSIGFIDYGDATEEERDIRVENAEVWIMVGQPPAANWQTRRRAASIPQQNDVA